MKTTLAYFLSTLLLCSVNKVLANEVPDTLMLNRIFGYARTIATVPSDTVVHSYTRYTVDIQRKNFSLLAVPSLFAMARKGQRRFMGESYQQLSPGNNKTFLSYTSLPHHGNIMPTVMRYLVPHIYNVTIVDRYLLSPFNIQNKSFYRYRFLSWTHDRVILAFTPKVDNTQLVRGNAVVDRSSGRVLTCHMEGEYDMLRFQLEVVPGTQGAETLLARECLLTSTFKFLGNRIVSTYRAQYGIPSVDTTLIDPRRPVASATKLLATQFHRQKAVTAEMDSGAFWATVSSTVSAPTSAQPIRDTSASVPSSILFIWATAAAEVLPTKLMCAAATTSHLLRNSRSA